MAEEQSKGIQQIEGCEVIYDMGSGLVIAKVPLDKVKEQDINARIMKNEMQDQLTANIKKRGQLESLPLFVLVDGKLEIISGHHRVKSARAAEMKETEFPEIREFVKTYTEWLKGQFPELDIELVVIRPKHSFKWVCENKGFPITSKDTAGKIRKLRHGKLSEKYRNYLLNGDKRGKFGMLAKKWQTAVYRNYTGREFPERKSV